MRTWIGVPSGCMKFVASSMQSIAIRTIARGWQPSNCNPPTAMYVAPTVSIFWTPCFSESSSNFDHTRSKSVTSSVGVSLATIVWNSMMSQKRTETSGSLSAMIVPVFFARRSVTCGGSMLSSIAFDFSRSSRSWGGEWGGQKSGLECAVDVHAGGGPHTWSCIRKSRRSERSRLYPPYPQSRDIRNQL